MKKRCLLLVAMVLLFAMPAYAAAPSAITWSSETAAAGASVIITINADDIELVAGYNINFSYDATVLDATNAAVGPDFAGVFFTDTAR